MELIHYKDRRSIRLWIPCKWTTSHWPA